GDDMEAQLAHVAPGSARDVDDAPATVFIVDGDRWVRASLEPLMRTAGWESESFASAEAFLSHAHGAAPCCVILDVTLPGLSGLELQQQLAGRLDMPIIFVTSHSDVRVTVQAMKAGAIEFLPKPVNHIALLHAI